MSFIADKVVMDGLTFDDVLLIPAYSEVLPREVDLSTNFSRNIKLNIPFVSAAMDTVTEAKLAIAIAREGGIGVIHKNMSIEAQAQQVKSVKRAENGMISNPVSILRDKTVGQALAMMGEYKIGGTPPVEFSGKSGQPPPDFPENCRRFRRKGKVFSLKGAGKTRPRTGRATAPRPRPSPGSRAAGRAASLRPGERVGRRRGRG